MFSAQKHNLTRGLMRHYRHLSLDDRKVIQKMTWGNEKVSKIAKKLDRCSSTIKREIERGKSSDGFYRANEAHEKYLKRMHSKKRISKIEKNQSLMLFILEKILINWSPEYISGRLKILFPDDPSMRISYESIYQWLYSLYYKEDVQLWRYLPKKRRKRKKRHHKQQSRLIIKDKKSIHDRPEEVETRDEIGHWEGDTVVGKNNDGYIVTLLERKSRLYLTAWIPDKKAETCVRGMQEAFRDISNEKIKTITFDNGTEFAYFKEIEEIFECDVYFADPYSSWQRGSNEQANGLLRRFYPKGTSFKNIDEKNLERNNSRINSMPRKVLNFLTPYEVFNYVFLALRI